MTSDQKKQGQDGENNSMTYDHSVLIVDDDAHVGQAFINLLKSMDLNHTYVPGAEQGIKAMETKDASFSMILSGQRMPGMPGTDFLSRAREISPETIRCLISGISEMDTIINAVNKGAVQHYISKPWQDDAMRRDIREGLAMFEKHLENEKLFTLAKKQNARLYELNCQRVENTKAHENLKKKLDQKIEALSRELDKEKNIDDMDPAQVINSLAVWIQDREEESPDQISTLWNTSLKTLYHLFSDLALRNGIEMSKPDPGGNNG